MFETWQRARLSDHADIAIGGTPSRSTPACWAGRADGHPWLAISDLRVKYISDTREHISDLGVRTSNVKLIPAGSTVMSFKLSVGRTAITTRPMYSNEAIAAFLPRSAAVDSAWLYHVLPRAAGTVVTDSAVKGATLNKAKMAEMTVMLPPSGEQHRIAQILDTLDTAIRQTETIIEKLKLVKQGLLHDLLTRGIDDNGELRPLQVEAPHLYSQSALGWIPREWRLKPFCEIGRAPQLGLMVRGGSPNGTNVGLLKMGNLLTGNCIDLSVVEPLDVRKIHHLEDFVLTDGDLLFNTRNTPELVGKTCSWRSQFGTTVFDNNLLRMQVAPSIGSGHFIASYMGAAMGRARLLGLATGTTSVAAIYWKDLRHFLVPLPPPPEQDAIVERLDACECRANHEKSFAAALAALKTGVMDDLLTGRVRVTPLLA